MKYLTQDGEEINGSSPTELVEALKAGGRFTVDQTRPVYMKQFADRISEFMGHRISYEDEQVFIDDLIRVGYLKAVASA